MALMDYMEAVKLLNKYGIKTVSSAYVESAEDAIKFAGNEKIVMKALSNNALHKSKSGLVELNLSNDSEIRNAYERITQKAEQYAPYKILVQKMAANGTEIIIGGREDVQFGKLLLVGLGGIYVEIFKDFSLRICPIEKNDAISMLEELKSKQIIAKDANQEEMVAGLLLKVSKLLVENNIKELDLNPVILYENDYAAVDIRILV